MRLKTPLILAGFWVMAPAQAPATFGPTAQVFDRQLRELKVGLLVVVDGPKGEWRPKLNALGSDPEWVDLDLGIYYFGSKAAEVEALLRQTYLAGPRPQWVLFREGGRVVASGGTFPESKAVRKLVEENQVPSMIQIMRDFCRRHPEHLEARETLCRWLQSRAMNQTLLRTGGKVESPFYVADEPYDAVKDQKEREAKAEAKAKAELEEKPPVQLDEEADQAIWGELAEVYAKSFQGGDWREMNPWGLEMTEVAIHSPLMQAMCRAAVPEVERALARYPTSWSVWRTWLGLTRTFGGKPLRPLLDSLVPIPANYPGAWPPRSVRDAYVKDARKRRDWTGIRDLLLPEIEIARLQEAAQEQKTEWVLKRDGKLQEDPETGDHWRDTLEPLVEALLHLGDLGSADDLVRDRYAKHPWSGLPGRASALAQRCGQPGLAARWGALGGGK